MCQMVSVDRRVVMKRQYWLAVIVIAMSSLYSDMIWAHGHGFGGGYGGGFHGGFGGGYHGGFYARPNVGLYFGGPYGYGGYGYGGYGYPYYAPPAVVTVPVAPPVYIQQAPPAPVAQQTQPGYWYYCNNPKGYYPYVKECTTNWQPVEPTPPSR